MNDRHIPQKRRNIKKKYTVVLLRPEYLSEITDEVYGQDIYVALVKATTSEAAILAAQAEAFKADKTILMRPQKSEDYKLCVLFEGHHEPRRFGWQY